MTTALPDYVRDDIQRNVSFALEEDIRNGDITAQLIDADSESTATIITREEAVMCGTPWAEEVFRQLGDVQIEWHTSRQYPANSHWRTHRVELPADPYGHCHHSAPVC